MTGGLGLSGASVLGRESYESLTHSTQLSIGPWKGCSYLRSFAFPFGAHGYMIEQMTAPSSVAVNYVHDL